MQKAEARLRFRPLIVLAVRGRPTYLTLILPVMPSARCGWQWNG